MKLRLSLVVAATAIALSTVVAIAAPSAQGAAPGSASYPFPVSGLTEGTAQTVTGTFNISRFAVVNGVLTAVGTFTGSIDGGAPVTTKASAAVTSINGTTLGGATAAAAAAPTGSCQILDLTLGPLHLDLLGLVVDLNQVHLTITAEQGAGNLLGNLLCAVAGLLDNNQTGLNALLQSIANLLNQILGQL